MTEQKKFLLNGHRTEFRQFQVTTPPAVGQTIHEHPVFGPLHDGGEGRLVMKNGCVVGSVDYAHGVIQIMDVGNYEVVTPGRGGGTIVTDLSQVHEEAIRAKLIEMGWRPPESADAPPDWLHCKKCGTIEVALTQTCHNSACTEYAGERTVYEGWAQPPAPIPAATHKLNADQTVAVATDVYLNPDMSAAPRGVKLQLIGEGGVAVYGTYNGDPFWKEWCPVPKRRKMP